MAFSLRLPEELDAEARARARRLGITLNGLVCVALDQYLRGSLEQVPAQQEQRSLTLFQREQHGRRPSAVASSPGDKARPPSASPFPAPVPVVPPAVADQTGLTRQQRRALERTERKLGRDQEK